MWSTGKEGKETPKQIMLQNRQKKSKEQWTRHHASDCTNNKMPVKMSLPEGRPAEGLWPALSAWQGRVPGGKRSAYSGVGNEIEDARDTDLVSPVTPL